VSGRSKTSVSKWRHQEIFWYRRHGKSAREIAEALGISLGTVSYYLKKGIPDYDPHFDTDRPIPDDLLTEDELRNRTTTVRPPRAPEPGKSYGSRTLRPPRISSLDAARRRRQA
jgi:hypothetical protein